MIENASAHRRTENRGPENLGTEQPGPENPGPEKPGPENRGPGQSAAQLRCPCGSSEAYAACCERFHLGAPAPTAEALMRSRYSANALLSRDPVFFGGYLHRTWAAEARPALSDLSTPGPQWTRLSILGTTGGGPFHDTGTVEFVAVYRDREQGQDSGGAGRSRGGRLHETSRFRRESGQWLYVDGDVG